MRYRLFQNLSDNRLGLQFAYKFVDALQHNSTLTHIILSGNDFDDACAVPMAEAIMVSVSSS